MNLNEQLEILEVICPKFKNGTSKREIRHDFFKNIKTEIQAYLLGFFASDGSINKQRHTMVIGITESDREIVELFRNFISPEALIEEVKPIAINTRGKEYLSKPSVRINIASKPLVESLELLGFSEAKTWKELHIPEIDKKLIPHFIRGYFDGDGCITGSVRKPNPANREKNYRVTSRWEICSKRDEILKDIQNFLRMLGISTNIHYAKRDDMYVLNTCSKKEIKKLFELLYLNANFYLNRKFNKFNYYVNTEVTQLISEYRNAQEVNVNESNNPPKSVEHPTSEGENVR